MATARRRSAPKPKPTDTKLVPVTSALSRSVAARFNAGQVVNLDWSAEKRYVLALLSDPNNDYLLSCALENPASVADALLDLSRLGLSLSPVMKQAYLIPYKTGGVAKVTLCPSYIGMEQSVLRSGKVTVIQTDLVYENDEFRRWTDDGGARFSHVPARRDRGALEGAYCLAKFANGESHMEFMPVEDIVACYEAGVRKNNGKVPPSWKYFRPEMEKKCVVRRAAKHWPSDKHVELLMDQLDRADPMEFRQVEEEPGEAKLLLNDEQIKALEDSLTAVEESARGVWVQRASSAMGYTGGPTTVPHDEFEALQERLLSRMNKVFGTTAPVEEEA